MAKSAKGGQFERQICKELSLWWTKGEREDVFWRTAGSGARATTRAKSNRQTAGSYGDITAIDPIGKPLLDVVTVECKRGYSTQTIADLLDHSTSSAEQTYEGWFLKAIHDHQQARSKYWMLITRRNQRQGLVFIPNDFYEQLYSTSDYMISVPKMVLDVRLRSKTIGDIYVRIVGVHFSDFLKLADPDFIKDISLTESQTK